MSVKDLFSTARDGPAGDYSLDFWDYTYVAILIILVIYICVTDPADNGARHFAKRPRYLALPEKLRRKAALLECSIYAVGALVISGLRIARPFIGGTMLYTTLSVLGLTLMFVYFIAVRLIVKRMVKKNEEQE